MAALKRILELGDGDAQVDGDAKGTYLTYLDAYSRVCKAMQNLIREARKYEMELSVKVAAATDGNAEAAEQVAMAPLRSVLDRGLCKGR